MSDVAVYLDLDGVMADYDAGIRALGFAPDPTLKNELNRSGTKNPFKRVMYEAIQGTEFYRGLPFMPGAVDLYRAIQAHDPIILTASPKFGGTEDDYFLNPFWLGAAYHKRVWVETALLPAVLAPDRFPASRRFRVPLPDERFICTTSARKHEFMGRKHSAHQILIDDRRDNIVRWARAGGVGILHTSAKESIDAFNIFTRGDTSEVFERFSKVPGGGLVAGLDDARTWEELDAAADRND